MKTLMYRFQRQFSASVRMPPSRSPIAPPAPAIAPKTPNARARSFGMVKVVVKTARAVGASSAPKAP